MKDYNCESCVSIHKGKSDIIQTIYMNCDICILNNFLYQTMFLATLGHTVHEGIKVTKYNKCELCGKSFAKLGSLKIHIMTIHE